MEREVAAMATRLESSLGLKRKEPIPYITFECEDDSRDVEIEGGMGVGIRDHGMEKTKDGKGSRAAATSSSRRPWSMGGEAESAAGSKEKGCSSTTAKPAGGRKRTKMVKYTIDISMKPLFTRKPLPYDLSRCSEAFVAAFRNYLELERNILKQFETKGYYEYEKEEEVTDDEDPMSV